MREERSVSPTDRGTCGLCVKACHEKAIALRKV